LEPVTLPYKRHEVASGSASKSRTCGFDLPPKFANFVEATGHSAAERDTVCVSAFAGFLVRLCGSQSFHLGLSESRLCKEIKGSEDIFSPVLPLELTFTPNDRFEKAIESMREELE